VEVDSVGMSSPDFHQSASWEDSGQVEVYDLTDDDDRKLERSQYVASLALIASDALALSDPFHNSKQDHDLLKDTHSVETEWTQVTLSDEDISASLAGEIHDSTQIPSRELESASAIADLQAMSMISNPPEENMGRVKIRLRGLLSTKGTSEKDSKKLKRDTVKKVRTRKMATKTIPPREGRLGRPITLPSRFRT
jgi:hypothetical protein